MGSRLREVRISENRVFRRKDSRLGRLPSRLGVLRFQEECVSRKGLVDWDMGFSRLIELRLKSLRFRRKVSRLDARE